MTKVGSISWGKYVVEFHSDGFPTVIALLDQQPAQITGGHGGWTTTARQRRVSLTQWNGTDPIRLSIPIIFDNGGQLKNDQVRAINTLGRMGLPPKNGGEPPIIYISGRAIPDPTGKGAKQPWVIENIQWGTNVVRNLSNNEGISAERQDCVVNLMEYIDEDRVHFPSISKHRGKKHKPKTNQKTGHKSGKSKHGWPKWYVIRSGDTLPKIAAKFYGDSSEWHRIADANKIRDPSHLKVGRRIKIPAPA